MVRGIFGQQLLLELNEPEVAFGLCDHIGVLQVVEVRPFQPGARVILAALHLRSNSIAVLKQAQVRARTRSTVCMYGNGHQRGSCDVSK